MKEASSMANDPRQPSTARPYVPPPVNPQDLPIDYSGFIAVVFGVMGVMLRYKLCSWLAIIFCVQSLANMRNFENDFKQISMAMMFAIMGLGTNYFALGLPIQSADILMILFAISQHNLLVICCVLRILKLFFFAFPVKLLYPSPNHSSETEILLLEKCSDMIMCYFNINLFEAELARSPCNTELNACSIR